MTAQARAWLGSVRSAREKNGEWEAEAGRRKSIVPLRTK